VPPIKNIEKKNIFCENPVEVRSFDGIETVLVAQACCTVFHYECSLRLTDCPKCERIAARSLDRLVTQSRLARELPLEPASKCLTSSTTDEADQEDDANIST
jgi:hypothetical protein